MKIGIPKEIKQDEYRVSLLPVGAHLLTRDGHQVLIEKSAGLGSGYTDEDYQKAGAQIVDTPKQVFDESEMIVKVKEPMGDELSMMRQGQTVFTYFHFAASKSLTQACLKAGITAVAYETLTDRNGRLPLLTPMSEVAGRMAVHQGAKYLEKPYGGRGVLMSGVPGVAPARVLVLGGGVVGTNAAKIAAGMGAHVDILDVNLKRLRYLDEIMPPNVNTIYSHTHAIAEYARKADLIIGSVLIPGGRTPVLISKKMLQNLQPGTVIIDVGVDQGGCIETSYPTTHADPIFVVERIVHYCVANMPGVVGRTSTQALCHATQPYVLRMANSGIENLVKEDHEFATALNMRGGEVTHQAVAQEFNLPLVKI